MKPTVTDRRPREGVLRPMLLLLPALMTGIALGSRLPGCSETAAAVAFAAALWIGVRLKRNAGAATAPMLLLAALGYLSMQPWAAPMMPPEHVFFASDGRRCRVVGTVAGPVYRRGERVRFFLLSDALYRNGRWQPASGKIRVTLQGVPQAPSEGDRAEIYARLKRLSNFRNPGRFDYKKYMAFQGTTVSAYATSDRFEIVARPPKAAVRDSWRKAIAEIISASCPKEAAAVLLALVIGDRRELSRSLRNDFARAGLGHVLAISGMHVGIVGAAGFFVFQRVLGFFSVFLWRAWVRKWAAAFAFLPVLGYGWLAGMSPSTQRAVLAAGVFLLAVCCEREIDPLSTLACAALVILTAHPPAMFSVSFQLSFAAVFFIITGMGRFARRAAREPATLPAAPLLWIGRRLGLLTAVSFWATLGSLPLIARYFNQISLIGLPMNWIAVPLIGFAVLPLGLAAAVLCPLHSAAAGFLFKTAGWILTAVLNVIHWAAFWPWAAVQVVTPSVLEAACVYLIAGALVLGADTRRPNPAEGNPEGLRPMRRRLRPARWACLTVLAAALVLSGDAVYWIYQRFWRPDLRISVLDVGQGSAALIELPRGPCALIDGGGFADNSAFDVGRYIVAPFLWRKKIRTVETLILSHPNSDHLNGLLYIADHFHVQTLWSNGEPADTKGYRRLCDIVSARRIEHPPFAQMARRVRLNGVEMELLYPPADFMHRKTRDRWRTLNNNSLVVRLRMGKAAILFPGDLMAPAERELAVDYGRNLASSVLVAPHHGSRSSSTRQLLAAVRPEAVVISAGRRNRFGMPHPDVLERYHRFGCRIFRTDRDGAVMLTTRGRDFEIRTYCQSAGGAVFH